jgi:hypothetical protein
MWDSFYNKGNLPANETEQYDRMVATEFQIEVLGTTYEPPRPQPVRGTWVRECGRRVSSESAAAAAWHVAPEVRLTVP